MPSDRDRCVNQRRCGAAVPSDRDRCVNQRGCRAAVPSAEGLGPSALSATRARPGWLRALSVPPSRSVLYGAFVWARRALDSQKRRVPARAGLHLCALPGHRPLPPWPRRVGSRGAPWQVAVPPLRRHSSALYRIRKRVRHLFLGASDAAAPSGGAPPRRAKRRRAGAGAAAAATAAAMI